MFEFKIFLITLICIWPTVVVLTNEWKGFDDSILYKINWPGNKDENFDLNKFEPMIVTTREQERYQCMIPIVSEKEEEKKSVDTNLSPLLFLMPLFSSSACSYRIEAYWVYEICHGQHVKQYHEEREGKNVKVQEYYLGKWDLSKLDQLHKQLADDLENGNKFKETKINNIQYPYVEIEMPDGTLCDLNNEPRITRVRYVCYPHRKNEIYSLKETSTCNYEAVILTSVLCIHPAFSPGDTDQNDINCMPLDTALDAPKAMILNEIENIKMRHWQSSDMFNTKDKIAIIKVDPQEGTLKMDIVQSGFEEKILNVLTNEDDNNLETPATNLWSKETATAPKDTSPVNQFLEGKNCLTGGTGWWKFEFCYGRYVRQFHIDKSGETSLFLGFYDENLHKEWLKRNPEKRPKPKNIRTDVSHLYQGGTICDKTGEKRQTEVKLKCLENVSSPSSVSMYLLEPKTCQYILVIESPLICDILQKADENGLVAHSNTNNNNDMDSGDSVDAVYIDSVRGNDGQARYEND